MAHNAAGAAVSGELRRVGLIGCGAAKRDRSAPARELYVGPLFRAARAYVEATCDTWGILSAKHWALLPDEIIEPYDLSLSSLAADHLHHWALVTRTAISNKFLVDPAAPAWSQELRERTLFVVVAGRRYRTPFQWGDMHWTSPWTEHGDMGIGRQLAWLKANTHGAQGRLF
jgi:Family of unknown function (DUF6884)